MDIMEEEKINTQDYLRFLYDKRLELFNKRRDHEWKILFGVIALIVACDAYLISHQITLSLVGKIIWVLLCFVIALSCIFFLFEIQKRNKSDRLIINEIHDLICDEAKISKNSHIRDGIEVPYNNTKREDRKGTKISNMWAFWPQLLVILLITVISIVLPFIK